MNAKVYLDTLNAGRLTALIAKLRSQTSFAILEQPDKIEFRGMSEKITATNWSVGRVFGQDLELYWERVGTDYRTRLTCVNGTAPPTGFREELSLSGLEAELVWYYLWGEDDVGIGGRLDYSQAIPGPGRGQLGVVEYRDSAGQLVFYRYTGLRREV